MSSHLHIHTQTHTHTCPFKVLVLGLILAQVEDTLVSSELQCINHVRPALGCTVRMLHAHNDEWVQFSAAMRVTSRSLNARYDSCSQTHTTQQTHTLLPSLGRAQVCSALCRLQQNHTYAHTITYTRKHIITHTQTHTHAYLHRIEHQCALLCAACSLARRMSGKPVVGEARIRCSVRKAVLKQSNLWQSK